MKNNDNNSRDLKLPIIIILILIVALIVTAVIIGLKKSNKSKESVEVSQSSEDIQTLPTAAAASEPEPVTAAAEETVATKKPWQDLLDRSEILAKQYDYDSAIKLLTSDEEFAQEPDVIARAIIYEAQKENVVWHDPTQVTHIFFHSLIIDTSLAFDGDRRQDGYNQVMTTADEFRRILEQLYDRGYVLVRMSDVAYEVEDTENGGMKMLWGKIRLPKNRIPVIISQDDVCYYEYQSEDGLASRMVLDEEGKPVCEYRHPDGTVETGEFDLVPILDSFIEEHPDFSYKGAKATLAFTGYNGILGYRTDECYDRDSTFYDSNLNDAPNLNIDSDRAEAVKVLKALSEDGYEFASHSWGHLDMDEIDFDRFITDCDRWERNVNSLIIEATGKRCNTMIYPKGSDIGYWKGYSAEAINEDGLHPHGYEKYCYMFDLGFRYFCNVDSSVYYVQKGNDYLRMGRRNIDGDRMWRDIAKTDTPRLSDLIDVETVFDSSRPTPVPAY